MNIECPPNRRKMYNISLLGINKSLLSKTSNICCQCLAWVGLSPGVPLMGGYSFLKLLYFHANNKFCILASWKVSLKAIFWHSETKLPFIYFTSQVKPSSSTSRFFLRFVQKTCPFPKEIKKNHNKIYLRARCQLMEPGHPSSAPSLTGPGHRPEPEPGSCQHIGWCRDQAGGGGGW